MEESNIIAKNKKLIIVVILGLVLISVVIWFANSRKSTNTGESSITPASLNKSFSKLFDNNIKPIEVNNFSLKIRADGDFVFNSVGISKFDVGKTIPLVLYSNSMDQAVDSFSVGLIYDESRLKYFISATKNEKTPWIMTVKNEKGKLIITGKRKEDAKNIILKETPLLDMRFETTKSGPVSFFFDNDEKISYIYNNEGKNILKDAVGLSLIIR